MHTFSRQDEVGLVVIVIQADRPLILIVDDVPLSLKVAAEILGSNGYRLALAESGSAALNFVADRHPDLILLAITMPDMGGFEVCRRLKESAKTAHIPVIFLAGNVDNAVISRSYDLGGVDYLLKPFNAAEMTTKVKNHVELARLKKTSG